MYGNGVPAVAKTKYACEILGDSYPTAAALRSRCREIIDRYTDPRAGLEQEVVGEDHDFFVELVRLRDASRIPSGTYVRRIVRCCRDGQVGRHIRFEYGNGTSDMIGWSKLCGGQPATFTQVSNAMREAVRDQMHDAYRAFFGGSNSGVCPKTGTAISYAGALFGGRAVVHHDGMPFAQIRDLWFEVEGKTAESLTLKDIFDGGGHTLADGEDRDSWRAFHAEKANLVVVSEAWHQQHHAASDKDGTGEEG